jgi:hypothetical protein
MGPTYQVAIRLPIDLVDQLRTLATKEHNNVSAVTRRLLSEALLRRKGREPRTVAAARLAQR